MFALSIIPVLIGVGAAVDYGNALRIRTNLDVAADSAAIAAVSKAAMALTSQEARTIATDTFKAGSAHAAGSTGVSVSVKVQEANFKRTVKVTYSMDVPASFVRLIGHPTIKLGGESSAVSALPKYIDFYVLLDNTPSMGLGATTDDIARMVANTPDQCAFACHDVSANGNDYYALAKKLGVQMRIDTVRLATQRLMDKAASLRVTDKQFRMGIYTFGASAQSSDLKRIQTLTTDMAKAKASASAIDLMTIPYSNYNGDTLTDFGKIFAALNNDVSTPGDGSSSSKAEKYVFVVTDGLDDRVQGATSCTKSTVISSDPKTGASFTRCQEPINPAMCAVLKNRGIKIAVLYTTYFPLPTNDWYKTYVGPWQNEIGKKLQECASPGMFFEVSPSQGISEALNTLFEKVVALARIYE